MRLSRLLILRRLYIILMSSVRSEEAGMRCVVSAPDPRANHIILMTRIEEAGRRCVVSAPDPEKTLHNIDV